MEKQIEKINIFISWAGSTSEKIAKELKWWLETVNQNISVFLSLDMVYGIDWNGQIGKELKKSDYGIIVCTKGSIQSDWLIFESGALANRFDDSRVCPVLMGITTDDIPKPLKQFQVITEFSEKNMKKLHEEINELIPISLRLDKKRLDDSFDHRWKEFNDKIHKILEQDTDELVKKSEIKEEGDLSEILRIVRSISSRISLVSKNTDSIKTNLNDSNSAGKGNRYLTLAEFTQLQMDEYDKARKEDEERIIREFQRSPIDEIKEAQERLRKDSMGL